MISLARSLTRMSAHAAPMRFCLGHMAQMGGRQWRSLSTKSMPTEVRWQKGEKQAFKYTAIIGAIRGFGITLFTDKKKQERFYINAAIKCSSSIPILFLSNKTLTEELFSAVFKGDFERAKFLIEKGGVDVNSFCPGWHNALLASFNPKTSDELRRYMSFFDFVLSRGYKHLNRPIYEGKEYNLLTNIYYDSIFSDSPHLRQKLIAFLLEKGVDPMLEKKNFKSALFKAFYHGDGPVFVGTCLKLGIPTKLKELNEDQAYELLSCAREDYYDFNYLLEAGVKISGPKKDKLLAKLEKKMAVSHQNDQEILNKIKTNLGG